MVRQNTISVTLKGTGLALAKGFVLGENAATLIKLRKNGVAVIGMLFVVAGLISPVCVLTAGAN